MHTVGSAEEARRAVASGVDVVVAQGWEAGGHVWSQVATLPLVPAVVDAVAPVPVIAAGGIGDARGVAAVLALGAQAAWLGTRFLLAQEMPIHEEYRRRLMDAAETDAAVVPRTCTRSAGRTRPTAPSATRRPRLWEAAGRPGTGESTRRGRCHRALRLRRTNRPLRDRRRRWPEPPVTSKRSRCGPDRASRSPGGHSQQQRSWPSSSRWCRRQRALPSRGALDR